MAGKLQRNAKFDEIPHRVQVNLILAALVSRRTGPIDVFEEIAAAFNRLAWEAKDPAQKKKFKNEAGRAMQAVNYMMNHYGRSEG